MEIITSLEAVKTEYSPSVIALGTFDGLHLGHQDIIKTARALSFSSMALL